MHALNLNEDNNVSSLAQPIDPQECSAAEFRFEWGDKKESASYVPFKEEHLWKELGLSAVILAEGEGLADKLLYVADIFTLGPRMNDRTIDLIQAGKGQEPQFRFRIRGKTDLGIFKPNGVM